MPRPATWARPWTPEEDALLREPLEAPELAKRLERSESGIHHRRARLGIVRCRRWSRADVAQLHDLWCEGSLSLRQIAKKLGRTVATTYHKAQEIGLPLGVPDGFEYLSVAAMRTGYCASQLWEILRWAGVRPHLALARTSTRRAGHRMHYVDPLDADDAIAAWHLTETVNAAARRLGMCGETLARWLHEAGVPDNRKVHKGRWRVETATIERVVADRMPRKHKHTKPRTRIAERRAA